MKNIVLVHGGFVDGSGWEGVYRILKGKGYTVSIVQNPTISLDGDVAVTMGSEFLPLSTDLRFSLATPMEEP
jgi:hypothetical protein